MRESVRETLCMLVCACVHVHVYVPVRPPRSRDVPPKREVGGEGRVVVGERGERARKKKRESPGRVASATSEATRF